MAGDAVTSLLSDIKQQLDDQDAQDEANKIQLLGDLDLLVGVFANYIQVLGVPGISGLIDLAVKKQTDSSPEMSVLQEITGKINELISLAGVIPEVVLMTSLFNWANPVHGNLQTLSAEGAQGAEVDATLFHEHALDFLNACLNDLYWYRPFVMERVFMFRPDGNNWFGDTIDTSGELYRVLPPTDTEHIEGYRTVFDPQLCVPALLTAIKSFLAVEEQMNPKGFSQYLEQWRGNLTQAADRLQCIYDNSAPGPDGTQCSNNLLGGFVTSAIPTADEIFRYMAARANHVRGGFGWNGVYGVIDIYGTYADPVTAPSSAPSHLIAVFPTDGIEAVQNVAREESIFGDRIYPWIDGRVRLGILARYKALYCARGYDKVWSILQSLRILTKQQVYNQFDPNKCWSAKELCSIAGIERGRRGGKSLGQLIIRLDQFARGTWSHPPDESLPSPDDDPWQSYLSGYRAQRPLGLRDRIAAVAV